MVARVQKDKPTAMTRIDNPQGQARPSTEVWGALVPSVWRCVRECGVWGAWDEGRSVADADTTSTAKAASARLCDTARVEVCGGFEVRLMVQDDGRGEATGEA